MINMPVGKAITAVKAGESDTCDDCFFNGSPVCEHIACKMSLPININNNVIYKLIDINKDTGG